VIEPPEPVHTGPGHFPATRHSILEHLAGDDEELRGRARATIAASYWNPLYKYLRMRWKLAREDAEDLVQGFLVTAFEKGWLDRFDSRRARFRTFVRVCADRYVGHWSESGHRDKRGGGTTHLSLDFAAAEGELEHLAAAVIDDPDELFRREFVRALFTRALAQVRHELESSGRLRQFELFERYDLADDDTVSYAALAAELGMTVTQVTNHLHAVRRRFRELVLAELRMLSAGEDEFRAEARDILGIEDP
jgi:RNA polymerase sigma-70 factor (ECF subfamily)